MSEIDTELNEFCSGITAAMSDIKRLHSRIEDAGQEIHNLRIRSYIGFEYEDELLEAIGYVGSAAMHIQYAIDELEMIASSSKTREDA